MTRRKRLENKLAKRHEWAEKAEARSDAAYKASNAAVAGIPLGQPILVGHHSEGMHRAALKRCRNAMDRSCEAAALAKHHESKADGIERQLEGSIFSDDENAIEAIEARIAELETSQEKMKKINAVIRKNAKASRDVQIAALMCHGLSAATAEKALTPDFCGRLGFPGYALTNNSSNIRRLRERIKHITIRNQRSRPAAAAPNGVTIEGAEYVRVTFAEKPEREILNALREAGFYWGSGSWCGARAKLPEAVSALIGGGQ